jgi:hypothetical protein
MIDQVLNAIIVKLNTYIGTLEPDVILGNIAFADAFHDNPSQNVNDKIIASVINIEQEESLRNIPFRRTVPNTDGLPQGVEQQPEIHLNVYVLFGANKNNYSTALQRISQVIGFFQRQFVYTPDDTPLLTTLKLKQLIFDLYSTDFQELNQVWSVLGGKYIPSVIYKMRMAVIQDAIPQGTGIIEEINLNTAVLSSFNTTT